MDQRKPTPFVDAALPGREENGMMDDRRIVAERRRLTRGTSSLSTSMCLPEVPKEPGPPSAGLSDACSEAFLKSTGHDDNSRSRPTQSPRASVPAIRGNPTPPMVLLRPGARTVGPTGDIAGELGDSSLDATARTPSPRPSPRWGEGDRSDSPRQSTRSAGAGTVPFSPPGEGRGVLHCLGERAITPLGSVVFSEDSPNSASMSRMAHRCRPRLRLREEWDSGSRIQDSRTLRNWHIWPGADAAPPPTLRSPTLRARRCGPKSIRCSSGVDWRGRFLPEGGRRWAPRVMGGAVSVLWVALAAPGSLTAQGPEAPAPKSATSKSGAPRGTPAEAVGRLVEQLERHPVQPKAARRSGSRST